MPNLTGVHIVGVRFRLLKQACLWERGDKQCYRIESAWVTQRLICIIQLLTRIPPGQGFRKVVCRIMELRVCVFEKNTTFVNEDVFENTKKIIHKHVKHHEKIMKNRSQIDPTFFRN